MPDQSGQADIRGINVEKLAKGFADIENVFKKFVTVSKTSAREIRWYQKTAGFLDSTDTTGMTASMISNVAERARPVVVEQSWTRNTSYVRKYFVESPTISDEDIKDADPDVFGTNVRDLTRAVERQVDARIYNVITEDQTAVNILSTASVGAWDVSASMQPIRDILVAKEKIYAQGYDPEGAVLVMNQAEYRLLLTYLIDYKGSSIPSFSSEKVKTGVATEILGVKIVVSANAVTDSVAMWIPTRSATWKEFMPITTAIISDPGIGKKIRVWEEGECILTDPKSVHLTTNTIT